MIDFAAGCGLLRETLRLSIAIGPGRPGIEFSGREILCFRETFALWLLFQVEGANRGVLIDRRTVGSKLFVLFATLQGRIGLQNAIEEFTFLFLCMGRRQQNKEQAKRQNLYHLAAACLSGRSVVKEIVAEIPTVEMSIFTMDGPIAVAQATSGKSRSGGV
ncbi:MAG: hypothetical protein QOI34_482, partial [Verrucomicrobiota bacterium]